MLKDLDDVVVQLVHRFEQDAEPAAVREARGRQDPGPWPFRIALGSPSKGQLVADIQGVARYGEEIDRWAGAFGLEVAWASRRAGGLQRVPTHVTVPDIDRAVRACGRQAQLQLARQRGRAQVLTDSFAADDATLVRVLKRTNGWNDLDFSLLVEAARWFGTHDAAGMTPRQVPLPGFHAKWLDAAGRRGLICSLCGKEDLGLVGRPALVEWAYLDPAHRAAGGRRYDSHMIGDAGSPAYAPRFVAIVENKDTYLAFPPLEGGICVFGSGWAGVTNLPDLDWVAAAPRLFYWGDMDAAGLEILDAYRAAGLNVESILMDSVAYEEYARFGTDRATGKQDLAQHQALAVPHLTPNERKLYELLTSSDCASPRRVEQERIPLAVARDELLARL
ncbi:MAG: DUF2220 family protein [Olegusella sp.]|nr:DUF2220 family protein [Olegusella sp.]